MGHYLNPADKVSNVGRRLHDALTFADAVRQLRSGEVLVGLYDRGIFKVAPWLHSAGEWSEFEGQYGAGAFLSKQHFALSVSQANLLGACIPVGGNVS
jgi:hypothetical protein